MKNCFISACLLALTLTAGTTLAQDQGARPNFVYATYFICAPEGESRADEIISTSFKPHYDAAVEQGDILAWSWMQHFVGGTWRRVLVIVTGDMDSLLIASGALGEIISDRTPEAGRAFSEICSSHEDYIWQTDPALGMSGITQERGSAGLSVYMKCDINGEERADKLVKDTLAPLYNQHVGEGQLTSWNWLKHNIGGEYRRLLIMTSADHKSLMKSRAAILDKLEDRKLDRAATELNKICPAHQDYLWDILLQTP